MNPFSFLSSPFIVPISLFFVIYIFTLCHLISSHLISSHLISSHLILSHLTNYKYSATSSGGQTSEARQEALTSSSLYLSLGRRAFEQQSRFGQCDLRRLPNQARVPVARVFRSEVGNFREEGAKRVALLGISA